jgi:tetratricopeptide (TPR) repeat protein
MDGRRTLMVSLGLLTGCLGCAHDGALPLAATPAASQPAAVAAKEPDLPPRTAKPATYIELGNFSMQAATDPRRSTIEREQLHEQARKAYQKALAADPKNLQALAALARYYSAIGDHPRTVAAYKRALQLYPREPMLYHELGMCHARHQEWDLALQNLGHAVELDPENRPMLRSLAYCLARARRYDESYAIFSRLDGDAMAHYNLARMLHHLQEDELSKEHLRLALRVRPDLMPASQLLAELENPVQQAGASSASFGIEPVEGAEQN